MRPILLAMLVAASGLCVQRAALSQELSPTCRSAVQTICGEKALGACFEPQSAWDRLTPDCVGDVQTMIEMEREAAAETATISAEGEHGYSYGGILRAGPGTDSRKITSLRNGERIDILKDTGVWSGGFKWFEVQSDAGRGYHWGGIFCIAGDKAAEGVLAACRTSEVPLTIFSCRVGGKIVSVTATGRQLTYHYGSEDKDELTLSGDPESGNVFFLRQRYAGVEEQLRFQNGPFSYIVYTMEGNAQTEASPVSGLVVLQGTDRILDKSCATHAAFTPAYDFDGLPEDSETYTAM
ncbi:SH3 domain-containing protein [Aurantimonas sp. VKM B-3413]|uniref:SH3 domain-containing protein n=1 Tax=Aurantimonas sp. VKM B-3413 TaxID=2779401 RepID=UPI001E5AA29D|nr:SH3 domain-containing protein [Aurantimonas sp. VKM B-3413]MCB8839747.1 SH3 domain-containing protein [Aurantimonas sp. VKM B-3413]